MEKNKWRVNTGCNLGYDQDENKVHINQLLLIVTMDCMLKCKYCAHFCDVNRGHVETRNILSGIESWSKKLTPKTINVMGGEPLLHRDVATVLRHCRTFWPKSDTRLITNGILLKKQDDTFFDLCETNRIEIAVSLHHQKKEQKQEIANIIEQGRKISLVPSYKKWMKSYEYDESGSPKPLWSDTKIENWSRCILRRRCTTLIGEKIYRCATMASAAWGVENGTMNSNRWGFASRMPCLNANSSIEDVFNFYFDQKPMDACNACGSGTIYEIIK